MSQPLPISDAVSDKDCCAPASPIDAGEYQGHSYHQDKAKILARLKRIEGQVRGVGRMVEEDKYCIDVLTQISASMSSLRAVGLLVLQDHIRGCVIDSSPDQKEHVLDELSQAIERFTRVAG